MKEATGQLNSTIIVIIAVGVLSAFFYYTLWPTMKANMDRNSKCSKAWCYSCTTYPDKCTESTQTCNWGSSLNGIATDESKDVTCARKDK